MVSKCCISMFLTCFFVQFATAQEKQVNILQDYHVETIHAELAQQVKLFTEYPGFVEARLFELEDSLFALEIYYRKEGLLYKNRILYDHNDLEKYRRDLKTAFNLSGIKPGTDQSGRALLLTGSTIVGLGYYGYATPASFDIEGTKPFLSLYMLSSGASFLLPYYTTKDKEVSRGQASLTFYGQTRGIAHGIFISQILNENNATQFNFAMGNIGSLSEAILSYKLARKKSYSTGDASIYQMGGDFGIITGFLLNDVFRLYDDNNRRAIFSVFTLSSAAGIYVGYKMAETRSYTFGDALYFRSSALLGAMSSLALVYLFEPGESQVYTSSALVGGGIGSLFAYKYLKNKDLSSSQGVLVSLGEISGALFGLGLGYLIAPDESQDKFMTTAGMIGGITGFSLMTRMVQNGKKNDRLGVNFYVNPGAYMAYKYLNLPDNYYSEVMNISLKF